MRALYQVLVIPFRRRNNKIEYAILKRSDLNVWQGIAGGGEDDETPMEAAARESNEELNISSNKFIKLNSICHIPTSIFSNSESYIEREIYTVPEYSFAVEIKNEDELELSREHIELKWTSYDECMKLLEWDSNKTALWELDNRLRDKL